MQVDVRHLEFMLENLPQNRLLYCDSGLWQVRTEDMEEVLFQQKSSEGFYEFIQRVYEADNQLKYL